MSKYGNRRVKIELPDGKIIRFDSVLERERYILLKDKEERGVISELILQPVFLLVDKFERNNSHYRAIKYIADFSYIENEQRIVEDTKGALTHEYLIKRKIFLFLNPALIFREVKKIRKTWQIEEF